MRYVALSIRREYGRLWGAMASPTAGEAISRIKADDPVWRQTGVAYGPEVEIDKPYLGRAWVRPRFWVEK